MKNLHETIEDMMVRLEEFESIIGMVRRRSLVIFREFLRIIRSLWFSLCSGEQVQTTGAECTSEHLPRLQSVRPELMTLCKRIDALEHVVARANVDLTALETAVDNAEAELGGVGMSDRLLGMLNPISHLFVSFSENFLDKPLSESLFLHWNCICLESGIYSV